MAKIVMEGQGKLIYGGCPRCPERISVYMKQDESFKNSKCIYCGALVHGDAISEIIREGHYPN